MKAPRPSSLTAIVLGILATVCFLVPPTPLADLLGAVCVGLLVTELDRSGRHIAVLLVYHAARLLPPRLQDDARSEWTDHVLVAGEEGLRPVLIALSIAFRAAPTMAFRYRIRPRVAVYALWMLVGYMSVEAAGLVILVKGPKRPILVTVYKIAVMVVGSAILPLYTVPGLRTRGLPSWLMMSLGMVLWLGACVFVVIGSAPVQLVCSTELMLWGLGLAVIVIPWKAGAGYPARLLEFIRGHDG